MYARRVLVNRVVSMAAVMLVRAVFQLFFLEFWDDDCADCDADEF